MRTRRPSFWKDLVTVLVAFFAVAAGKTALPGEKIPVILDTDIGDDIDDTWALVLLLKSPQFDLKLVATDYGNTTYRAKVAAKILEVAGRTDVPVAIGLRGGEKEGPQAPWVRDYDLSRYPGKVHEDGVQAIIDAILGSPKPVTLISIGPVPNIRAALEREPKIAERARFVGMHGSVRRGYGGKPTPDAEWNVRADPAACAKALGAPWPVTITPLDTCGLVHLRGEKYAAVRDSRDPLVQALVENYRIWCGDHPERAKEASSTLFDTVAVYLAGSEDLCVMEELRIRVEPNGMTVVDPGGKPLRVAVDWKSLPAFEDFLVERLTGRAPSGGKP